MSDPDGPALAGDEQVAMDKLLEVMEIIRGWGLQANQAELTQAVHVIQGFIIQRMLQRLAPDLWGVWYS